MAERSSATSHVLAVIEEGVAASVPANIVLMRGLIEATTPAHLDTALAQARQRSQDAGPGQRLRAVEALWRSHRQAWQLIHDVLATADHGTGQTGIVDQSASRWAATFDRLAETAPDAGMALYALGDPDLLAAATAEVVDWLDRYGLLRPDHDAVEIGCGNGRFLKALAPKLRFVTGLDVSAKLVMDARTRCSSLGNVRVNRTAGEDLGALATASVDLVLAVDVFPYLHLAGQGVVDAHLRDAARLLRPGGSLVILNYAYGVDPTSQQVDLARRATAHGLLVQRFATGDFTLWDGTSHHLRRPTLADTFIAN